MTTEKLTPLDIADDIARTEGVAEDREYRIHSTALFHAPGLFGWLRRAYITGDAESAIITLAVGLPTLPIGLAIAALEGVVDTAVDGDTVVLTMPEDTDELGAAINLAREERKPWRKV